MQDVDHQTETLREAAAFYARDAELLRVDVASAVFPASVRPPTEALLSGVSRRMTQVFTSIEQGLSTQYDDDNAHWPMLLQSPVARDPMLVDFLIARFSESRLEQILHKSSDMPLASTIPALLLQSSESLIADCAQTVLAMGSLARREATLPWYTVPPELLHRLCWRIAALMQRNSENSADAIDEAVEKLLKKYDPMQTSSAATKKLLHLLNDEYAADISHIEKAGVAIFTQKLSDENGLVHDHVLRLLNSHSPAPFAILQRGANIDQDVALENISRIFGFNLTPNDIISIESGYDYFSIEEARDIAQGWRRMREGALTNKQASGEGRDL